VTVYVRGEPKPLATLAEFDPKLTNEEAIKNDFTFDRRVYLVPEAKVIVTVPTSDDRIVLYRYGS
jgi:hypothetical protein